jgi:hypothetical protein
MKQEISTSSPDIDTMLSDVNIIIDSYSRYKRMLQRQRNLHVATVSRLPDEVLILIFDICGPSSHFTHSHQECVPRQALAFSQVCVHWRNLSLGTPALWVAPIFSWRKQDVGVEMMERAKRLPLLVNMNMFHSPYITSIFTEKSDTLHSLVVNGLERLLLPALKTFAQTPLPLLEHLKIVVNIFEDFDDFVWTHRRLELQEVFGNGATCLKGLSLHNCTINYKSSIYSKLTALHIDLSDLSDFDIVTERIPLLQILAIFEIASQLEDIRLLSAISAIPGIDKKLLDMPSLRCIHLADEPEQIVGILNCLCIRPIATISIEVNPANMEASLSDHELVFIHLSEIQHFQGDNAARWISIEENENEDAFDLRLRRSSDGQDMLRYRLQCDDEDEDDAEGERFTLGNMYRFAARHLHLGAIQTARLGSGDGQWFDLPHGHDDAVILFKTLPQLQNLTMLRDISHFVLAALCSKTCITGTKSLKNLKDISIHEANLNDFPDTIDTKTWIKIRSDVKANSPNLFDLLFEFVHHRSEHEHELKSLKLDRCIIPEADGDVGTSTSRLAEFVADLQVML